MGNFSQVIDAARVPQRSTFVSVAKAGAYAGGANIAQVFCGLLATALLARFLGPEQKGVYDLCLATAMLFTVVLSMALNAGVTYVVASQSVNCARLMRILTLIGLAEASAALILLYLGKFTDIGRSFVPTELGRWGALAIAVTIFLLATSMFYRAVLVGHQEFIAASYGDVGRQVLGLVFIVTGFAVYRFFHVSLVYAMVFANMAAVGITIASYGLQVPPATVATNNVALGPAFRFAFPSYFASTAQYLNNRIDLFFVYRYWGAADVGLYQTAVLIALAINLLPTAMQGILFPTISSGTQTHHETVDMVVRVHRLLFAFTALVAGSLAALGPFIIPLVFGKRFAASAVSLALLAPGCAVFATTNILAAYFAGTGRPHINLINSLIGTAVTIVLDLTVVPRYAFYGASVVSSLSYTATTVGCLIVFCRETGINLRKLFVPVAGDWVLVRQYQQKLLTQMTGVFSERL
jgi:O-antigen/teichoic acid export membrane protein